MSEGNFFDEVFKFFKPKPPNTETISQPDPETKAKHAFLEAITATLTPEELDSSAIYEPPHAIFDLSTLGDGTVFRIESTQQANLYGRNLEMKRWTYGCIVEDSKTKEKKLFIPLNVYSDGKKLVTDTIYDADTLVKNHHSLHVKELSYSSSELDWENPEPTLSKDFFVGMLTKEEAEVVKQITLHRVELVVTGTYATERTIKPRQPEQISLRGLTPNPKPSV